MGFLSDLGSVINEQFGASENTVTSLDSTDGNGRTINFGSLGDFATKFDQSAQRSYLQDGFIRNVRPRATEILYQTPDLTVVIKKRMFSSLVENFKLELADETEKLFIRASKRLFQNKCNVISKYEQLTKIEKLAKDTGAINSYVFPQLMSALADLESFPILNLQIDGKTRAALEKIRRVYAFSEPSQYTKWAVDSDLPLRNELGEGAGTFELTTVQSINTTVSTEFARGSASLTIEDPYKLMVITSQDIDNAISDASNFFKNNAFTRFSENELEKNIEESKQELNLTRERRGASRITFIVSPQTLLSKKLRAIVDGLGTEIKFQWNPGLMGLSIPDLSIPTSFLSKIPGIPSSINIPGTKSGVEIDPEDLAPSNRLGIHALTVGEARLFSEVVKNVFLLISYQTTSQARIKEFKGATNYVRQKMRLHYCGKNLIQPLDIVNIFISSKTRMDEKLTVGFETQTNENSLATRINNLVRNINTTLGDLSSGVKGDKNSWDDVERAAIVGADFPAWLWKLLKNDFTRQAAGLCVFSGLVTTAPHSYSDGKYMLNVTCEDNAGYFNKSQINIKPSTDVFNGQLYDPLTPFKVSYDAATGDAITDLQQGQYPELLDENKILLNSEAIRFKSGRFRGDSISQDAHKAKDIEFVGVGSGYRNVINNPDGFVYRWKEGIASLTKTERVTSETSISPETSILLTADPFAGQDVMNVVSLLVTGQPYNFNSFLKAAIVHAGDFTINEDISNKDHSVNYLEALTDSLEKNNSTWGNFIPFKKLIINEEAYAFIKRGQVDLITQNTRLNGLLQRRASLLDEQRLRNVSLIRDPQALFGKDAALLGSDVNGLDPGAISLQNEINKIDSEIRSIEKDIQRESNDLLSSKTNGQIKIFGDDISLSPSAPTESSMTEEQRLSDRGEFRKRIGQLTQRRLWKTKANEDINLFIVDDQYDKNWDIQAYESRLGGSPSLLNSEYLTVEQKIVQTAKLLDLEIFADSQGHIQVRPPQYNKIPSSVFFKMFRDRDSLGIQVFPKFLESLYFNQIQGVINRIEIVEDEIRLRATALGVNGDKKIGQFLRGANDTTAEGFAFVTNENGLFGSGDFKRFITQANPDLTEDIVNGPLKELSSQVSKAAKPNVIFDSVSKENQLRNLKLDAARTQYSNDRLFEIRERLERNKGIKAPTDRELFSNDRFRRINEISQLDALNLLNQISTFISERQSLLISANNAVKNLSEGILLNTNEKGGTTALFPQLYRKQAIPTLLEHMIEDEDFDDLGPGSGSRYFIKDSSVISLTVNETPPQHTLVEVNGLFGQGFVDGPTNLRLTASGGNAVTSAFAVDYDLWRMYGFRAAMPVSAPFFTDPDSQCAPYAVALLNRERKNILQGSLTVIGNEFYQAGDVIYLEDRDLLFYVSQVQHTFSYSGTFQTTLTLKFGHNPGEYIPTMLDIIGKILYNSKGVLTGYRNSRFDNPDGSKSVGTLVFDNIDGQTPDIDSLLSSTMGKHNSDVLNSMLLGLSGILNPINFRRQKPKLELRIYYNSKISAVFDPDLLLLAEEVKSWLRNPQSKSINSGISLIVQEENNFQIPDSAIDIKTIDTAIGGPTSDTLSSTTGASPSSAAWNLVRSWEKNRNGPADSNKDFKSIAQEWDNLIYSHIIDGWVVYEDIEDTIETQAPGIENISQSAQDKAKELETALKKKANG